MGSFPPFPPFSLTIVILGWVVAYFSSLELRDLSTVYFLLSSKGEKETGQPRGIFSFLLLLLLYSLSLSLSFLHSLGGLASCIISSFLFSGENFYTIYTRFLLL
ncbi:hypothetical protein F4809DRAFT_268272 [Biscogniauxia mediterranea]|nr:hypothetical protein F4809DRAFT_268272 [Biscogniauxia mediterranea]